MYTPSTSAEHFPNLLTACGQCDLLLQKERAVHSNKAICPRCSHVLHRAKTDSIDRSLALAIAGLILTVPANVLPILRLEVLGIEHDANMLTGVSALFINDMWILSFVVLLASIIVPILKLLLVFSVSLGLKLEWKLPNLALSLRWYRHIEEWGMLEVYTLGIIVAYTKLIGMAQVVPELGMYCFVAVLFIVGFISSAIDEALFWELIEEQQRG